MLQHGDSTLGNRGLESECGMVGSDGKRPTSSAWFGPRWLTWILMPGVAGPTYCSSRDNDDATRSGHSRAGAGDLFGIRNQDKTGGIQMRLKLERVEGYHTGRTSYQYSVFDELTGKSIGT